MAAQWNTVGTHDEGEGWERVRRVENDLVSFYYLQAELPGSKIVKSVEGFSWEPLTTFPLPWNVPFLTDANLPIAVLFQPHQPSLSSFTY